MVIEVEGNIIKELITKTSKLKKMRAQFRRKTYRKSKALDPSSKDKNSQYVESWDRSNRAENGPGPARNQTDSHPICSAWKKGIVLAVQ